MNTILRKLTTALVVIALSVCAFAGCASVDETGADNVYKCSKQNIIGLKEVVLYEDKAVVVFDKFAGIGAQKGYDYFGLDDDSIENSGGIRASVKTDGKWCPVKDAELKDTFTDYIVTIPFEDVEDIETISVLGRYITINDGDFELSYLEWGGECSVDYTQKYDAAGSEWSEMKIKTTLYPMTDKAE